VRATGERLRRVRDAGAIVLVTTHDLEAIEPLADRALVLTGGRLTPIDSAPGGLRERYRRATAAS
jgi:ABC-type multidrug transport system ATPase subunit